MDGFVRMVQNAFTLYLREIRSLRKGGKDTEHTYRPALKKLLETLTPGIVVTNEPRHRTDCGAPDILVRSKKASMTIGYLETKPLGCNLDEAEQSEQLKRYRGALPNLILTDYLEFRWYVDGEPRAAACLARLGRRGEIPAEKAEEGSVRKILWEFLARSVETLTSPKELAERMARLTHMIRDIIIATFEKDRASAMLGDLRKAVATALIPDLDQPAKTAEFADMFAQTIAYGLFAARCNHRGPKPFRRLGAASEIPKTNPFLRKLFEAITGSDLDEEPYAGFVDDVVELLAHTDIDALLEDFGKRTRRQDPTLHFYETFLAAYDPKLRRRRGVYYTPEPIVWYIIHSVDHLLKAQFDCGQGLADASTVEYEREDNHGKKTRGQAPRVLVLDPACGTGTFLYAVVDLVREQFMVRGDAGMWSGYVKNHLLPRLFGFELLMAPYAVAHFKLGMQLAAQDMEPRHRNRWAYNFVRTERLGIYLTNTLETAERIVQEQMYFIQRIIAEEANAATRIKRDLPIMVVIGNPPYSNFGQMNRGKSILGLLKDYKKGLHEKKLNIDDDFIKFIRFGQWRIERTGAGILGFISNNTYIDGITHRRMRQSLMETFSDIYILDLHGSSKKKETCPDGSKDTNVFDIQQGVAIGIFVKKPGKRGLAKVHHADLWGIAKSKYARLLETDAGTTKWSRLQPKPPYFFFVPKDFRLEEEYSAGWRLDHVFWVQQSGLKTDRDELFQDFDRNKLHNRIKTFYSEAGMRAEFREAYGVEDSSSYDLLARRLKTSFHAANIQQCLYRPFDVRWLYYERGLTSRPAWEVMRHMLAGRNMALIGMRQYEYNVPDYCYVSVTDTIVECRVFVSNRGIGNVFPLYLYPSLHEGRRGILRSEMIAKAKKAIEACSEIARRDVHSEQDRVAALIERQFKKTEYPRWPNLDSRFVAEMKGRLKLTFVPDGTGDLKKTFGPEDVFHYIYAVFHSPTYRERYAEFLKIDFPRVPLTSDRGLFRTLCAKGKELVGSHLLQSDVVSKPMTTYPVPGDDVVVKGHPRYLAPGQPEPGTGKPLEAGRVYISRDDRKAGKKGQYFDGVPPEVWEFHIGGYQVSDKWLKDRRGRQLAHEDLVHYQKIVVAIRETVRLMAEIDGAIPSWPIT